MERVIQGFLASAQTEFPKVHDRTTTSRWAWKQLEHIRAARPPDSFCQIVRYNGGILLESCVNKERVMGYRNYNFEEFLESLRPKYISMYINYLRAEREGWASRKPASAENSDFLSTLIPIRNDFDSGKYWWVRQIAYAMKYSDSGEVITVLYVYRLSHRYDQHTIIRPEGSAPDIERAVVLALGRNVLREVCSHITPRQQRLLYTYWRRMQRSRGEFPSVRDISEDAGLTIGAIRKYNQELLRGARLALPFYTFRNVEELIRYIARLMGKISAKDFLAILP